jgi:CCR4-NOT complex subunit CAF16
MADPVIDVCDLSFRYGPGLPPALREVRLELPRGSRCLLVGANGAGKTTLLRILAGKHMLKSGGVKVLGRPAFDDTTLAGHVSFIGGSFPFEVDVRVGDMLERAGGARDRIRELVKILDVDQDWHMHRISDGQRRRVQLVLGLVRPFEVLLLDEITTDLDLIARADLLDLLRDETDRQGATILYATHILDRMDRWATHLAFLDQGQLRLLRPIEEVDELQALRSRGVPSPLSELVETWMRIGH